MSEIIKISEFSEYTGTPSGVNVPGTVGDDNVKVDLGEMISQGTSS